jgi:hypothetical protein
VAWCGCIRLRGGGSYSCSSEMALKPWFPKAAVLGGLLAALFFVVTISFMITTSGIGE